MRNGKLLQNYPPWHYQFAPEKGVIGIRSFPVGMGEDSSILGSGIFCRTFIIVSYRVWNDQGNHPEEWFLQSKEPTTPNATRQQSSPPPPKKKIPRKTMSSNCLVTDLLKVSNSSGLIPSVFWRFGRPCWKETEGFWERFSGNDFETNSLKHWGLKKMSEKPTFLFLDLLKVVGKVYNIIWGNPDEKDYKLYIYIHYISQTGIYAYIKLNHQRDLLCYYTLVN